MITTTYKIEVTDKLGQHSLKTKYIEKLIQDAVTSNFVVSVSIVERPWEEEERD